MKTVKNQQEVLTVGEESVLLLKQALHNTSRRTMISNNSIEIKDDGQVIIEPTSAMFLINLGMEYQKLLSHKCPVCFSIIEWK